MKKKITTILAGIFLSGMTFAQNPNRPYYTYSAGGDGQSFPYNYIMYDANQDGTLDQVFFRQNQLRYNTFKDNKFEMGEKNLHELLESPLSFTKTNSSLLSVDVDNNNNQDLVYVNGDSFHIFKLSYNGSSYTNTQIISGSDLIFNSSGINYSSVQKLLAGDFTADGRQDIVIGNYQNKLFLATQNTDGSFTKTAITSENHSLIDMKVLDYTKDGKMDIITLSSEPNNTQVLVTLFAGDGEGGFTKSTLIDYTASTGYWSASNNRNALIVEDLNNDNKLDIVFSGNEQPSLAYLNNGNSTFTQKVLTESSKSIYLTTISSQKVVLVGSEVNGIFKIYANSFFGTFVNTQVTFEKDVTGFGVIDWYGQDYDGDTQFDFLLSRNSYGYYYTSSSPIHENSGNLNYTNIRLDFAGNSSQSFKVTASNQNGATLNVTTGSGATVTGDGTNSVSVQGTYTQIVKALQSLKYTGEYNGYQEMDIVVETGGQSYIYPTTVKLLSTSLKSAIGINTLPSSLSVCEGDITTIPVTAQGVGSLFYQWQIKNGDEFVNLSSSSFVTGTTSNQLSITANSQLNGAILRCKVWSGNLSYVNEQYSSQIVLTVNSLPDVNLGEDITKEVTDASFELNVTSGYASYLWNDATGTSSYTVVPSSLGIGSHTITLDATTDAGCTASDEIIITIGSSTIVAIPDANFKAHLVSLYDTNKDGQIQFSEAEAVTGTINVRAKNITSLTGIEKFTNLTRLDCANNQLTTLDLGQNTALKSVNCAANQLTSLNVMNSKNLTSLYCYNNQLSTLNILYNTNLLDLHCGANQLTTLNTRNNIALKTIKCYSNRLTSLDLSQNTELTYLWCENNRLTSLDLLVNNSVSYLNARRNFMNTICITTTPSTIIKDASTSLSNCGGVVREASEFEYLEVIKAYNLQGMEVPVDTKGELIILLYNNGATQKVFKN